MVCSDDEYADYMNLVGSAVGEVWLNFEANGDGVAFKFKNRDEDLLVKSGERDATKIKFMIPDDEELVGFHGKQDENSKITELGVITRKANCPGVAPSTTGGQPPADPLTWNSGFNEGDAVEALTNTITGAINNI